MIEVRYFPNSWEQFEEQVLLFLFSGRERLSRYGWHALRSEDIDEANFYQRYVNLLNKWRQKLSTIIHPLEQYLKTHPEEITDQKQRYLKKWQNYLHQQLTSLDMELQLIQLNLMGKIIRYQPPRSGIMFPD